MLNQVTDNFITEEINQFYRTTVHARKITLTQQQMECLAGEASVLVLHILTQDWRIGNNAYMRYLPEDVQE
jgi:hypothetical protein